MNVDCYIENTRVLKDSNNTLSFYENIFEKIYISYYESIKKVMNVKTKKLPEIKICYSINRTCEMVTLQEKEYLIYDRYLGQSLNMLNRLYLNSTNKSEAEAYGYKLLAEKMYTIGCYKYAQLFAIKYVDLKEKSDSYKKDVNLKKREKYTEVQELFVMCHELAHWILADGENNELMNNKREFLIDVFNNYNDISFPEPFMEYFINIRYNAFFDKDEEPRKLRLPSEYKEVKEEEFDSAINNR